MDRVNGLMVIMIAIVVAIAPPVFGFVPIPTELDVNLLNLDASNIDVSLLLTICYNNDTITLDWECINSVDNPDVITWEIYNGKSNLYGLIPAKDGTDINITVEGYEMIQITAIEDGLVTGDYYLVPVPITRTAEFDTVINRAITKNGQYGNNVLADVLYTALNDGDISTTPLVVDVRSFSEYAAGHIPGAINIYYRDFGKASALSDLDSALAAHKGAGGKGEIIVYGNTRHLSMLVLAYLRELGYNTVGNNAVFQLSDGFAAWTQDETVAPGRFKLCTSFDSTTGKGTAPADCTENNFPATTANPVNNSDGTHGGQGFAELNTGGGTLQEIIRLAWDARFGDMSKPEYRMTAAELYDLLDDNQDGVIRGSGDDLSNDPYILSNRGTTWTSPYPVGPYYTAGHIPSGTAVDWAWVVSGSNKRQELRSLDRSDFLPTDRIIVHHCWVGVSQQYGGFWYNMLNYTTVSLDWGMWGWTTDSTVRAGGNINPDTIYPNDYPFETTPTTTTTTTTSSTTTTTTTTTSSTTTTTTTSSTTTTTTSSTTTTTTSSTTSTTTTTTTTTSTTTTTVSDGAALEISKVMTSGEMKVLIETKEYWVLEIEVNNSGQTDISNVVVSDTIPQEITLDGFTVSKGSVATTVKSGATKLTWTIGTMSSGDVETLVLDVSTKTDGTTQYFVEAGEYVLNEGASVSGDSGQISAGPTDPITVFATESTNGRMGGGGGRGGGGGGMGGGGRG